MSKHYKKRKKGNMLITYPNNKTGLGAAQQTTTTSKLVSVGLYLSKDGQVCECTEEEGWRAYTPVRIPSAPDCGVRWSGSKIPMRLWLEVCSFMEWTTTNTQGESVAQLYHNPTTGEWKAWAFPQRRAQGLTAEEIQDHPERAEQRKAIDNGQAGWMRWGSIHNHRKSAAFASSTDDRDEAGITGVHITIGSIGSDAYSIHGRVILKEMKSNIVWSDWFEMPEFMTNFPVNKWDELLQMLLTRKVSEIPFPDKWKENMVAVPDMNYRQTYVDSRYPERNPDGEWCGKGDFDTAAKWLDDYEAINGDPVDIVLLLTNQHYNDMPVMWSTHSAIYGNPDVCMPAKERVDETVKGGWSFMLAEFSKTFFGVRGVRVTLALVEHYCLQLPITWWGTSAKRTGGVIPTGNGDGWSMHD